MFSLPTTTDIHNIIITSKCSSPSEPLPLQTLKKLASTIAPIYKRFIDESIITGTIPSDLKHSIISPLIKKPKLDCNTLSNYIPISQLTTLTKLLEKVIYKQLILYLTANNILDPQQCAFRKLHSTETTILSLLDDLLKSLDNDFPTQLMLLDLSSAFDTINLDLLIYRLKLIGLEDTVLLWFSNYITNRTYSTKINKSISPKHKVIFGVPQGPYLSPILFCIYLLPLSKLIKSFPTVKYNIYADDIEIHADCHQSSKIHLQACLTTINNWLTNNYLLLNPNIPTNVPRAYPNPSFYYINISWHTYQ